MLRILPLFLYSLLFSKIPRHLHSGVWGLTGLDRGQQHIASKMPWETLMYFLEPWVFLWGLVKIKSLNFINYNDKKGIWFTYFGRQNWAKKVIIFPIPSIFWQCLTVSDYFLFCTLYILLEPGNSPDPSRSRWQTPPIVPRQKNHRSFDALIGQKRTESAGISSVLKRLLIQQTLAPFPCAVEWAQIRFCTIRNR